MARLSADIYRGAGERSLAGGIADSLNQHVDRQNKLAQLAHQREQQDTLHGYQTRAFQRVEDAYPAQQAELERQKNEKTGREFNGRTAAQIKLGKTNDEIIEWAKQEGAVYGLKPEQIQAGLAPLMQIQDREKLYEHYQSQAFPEITAKAEIEARHRKQEKSNPSSLAILHAEREQIAAANPNDPRLEQYDQAIKKNVSQPPFMQVATGEGGEQYMVSAPKGTGKASVQPLGIKKPTGKAGTPDDVAAAKEQASLSSQQVLDQAEKLFKHPGRGAGTGASSWLGNIPGTDAKGFQANLETFKSQTFLPMVSALKGMGALSDAEGKKITASVGALDPQMPEAEFEQSVKDTTRFLFNKAKAAGLNVQVPAFIADEPVRMANNSGHRQDNEAVMWAKSNPGDPRSAAILKANGY